MPSNSEKKVVLISSTDFVKLMILLCVADARVIDQPTLSIQNFQDPELQRNHIFPGSHQKSERLFYDRISEQPQNEYQTVSEIQPVPRGAPNKRPLRIRFASGTNARLAIRSRFGRRIQLHLGGQAGSRRIHFNFGNSGNVREFPGQSGINDMRTISDMESQNQRFQSAMMRDGLGTSRRRIVVRSSGVGEPRRVIVNTRGGARIHLSTGGKQIVIRRSSMHPSSTSGVATSNRPMNIPIGEQYANEFNHIPGSSGIEANDRSISIPLNEQYANEFNHIPGSNGVAANDSPNNTPLNERYDNEFNSIQRNNGLQTDFNHSQQILDQYFDGHKNLEISRKSQSSVDELIRDIVRSISEKRSQTIEGSMTTDAPDADVEEAQ